MKAKTETTAAIDQLTAALVQLKSQKPTAKKGIDPAAFADAIVQLKNAIANLRKLFR
jgi:hypothetical protein